MSQQSCSACNDLREYAPEFVVNGVTDNVCDNLNENKGLSDVEDHDDCSDLHDVNDCLIGNMQDEVEGFDVCEWKEFMHQYIPNNYETLKAMICSMCGLWSSVEDLCKLIGSIAQPSFQKVGSLPKSFDVGSRCGTIPTKNGRPIMIVEPYTGPTGGVQEYNYKRWLNVGIQYASTTINSCGGGGCKRYEWFFPDFYNYEMSKDVARGDVLWYVDKASLQAACGFSDSLWQLYTESSWTWTEVRMANGKTAAIHMSVNPNGMGNDILGLRFLGTSYPDELPGVDIQLGVGSNMARTHISSC